jgi:hypothetical protein
MIPTIFNNEEGASAREKINRTVEAVNSKALIPPIALAGVGGRIRITCYFPDDADFLNHHPKIYLHRYVHRALAPYSGEKRFTHPRHLSASQTAGVIRALIVSEFPFNPPNAVKTGTRYSFFLVQPDGSDYTYQTFCENFGLQFMGANGIDAFRLTRCAGHFLTTKKADTTDQRITVTAGFSLSTKVGKSPIARCAFGVQIKTALNGFRTVQYTFTPK